MILTPISITGIFFFGSIILTYLYLSSNSFIRTAFKKYWFFIVLLIFLNLASKIPYKSNFFDGMEYEDSYIYKASARALYEGNYEFSNINPYYPTSTIYGSIKNSRMSAIFVTNFLGYPYLIDLAYHIFGYHINISNFVSLAFSGFSIVFVFLIALLIIESLAFALICSFVYLTIPIFNVYASTSLTEPLSNVLLTLVLLVYLIFNNPKNNIKETYKNNLLGISAIFFTMILSILFRTTNLSLVFCLPLSGLIYIIVTKAFRNKFLRNKLFMSLSAVSVVFLFSYLIFNFQTAVEINKGDIGVNPFSFSFFKSLAPVFAKSFFNFEWYLFYSALFFVGLYYGLKKKNGIYPIIIFLFYFALFTSHYRSYYFTRGIPATSVEALRYMTSLVSIYSLIVGIGIFGLGQWINTIIKDLTNAHLSKSIAIAVLILVIGISIVFTLKNRSIFVEDEYNVRIAPVMKTLEYLINKNDVLITSEHILFQIYGNANLKLMAFCSIENQIPKEEVESLIRSSNVYYLQNMDRGGVDEERYQKQFKDIDSKPKILLFSEKNYQLFKLLKE